MLVRQCAAVVTEALIPTAPEGPALKTIERVPTPEVIVPLEIVHA